MGYILKFKALFTANLSFCPSIHERRSDVWYVHKLLFWVESFISLSSTQTQLHCLKASCRKRLAMHKVYLSLRQFLWNFYDTFVVLLIHSFWSLYVCSIEERTSYGFGMIRGLLNDDRMLIFFGWTNPVRQVWKIKGLQTSDFFTCVSSLVKLRSLISLKYKSCLDMRERRG